MYRTVSIWEEMYKHADIEDHKGIRHILVSAIPEIVIYDMKSSDGISPAESLSIVRIILIIIGIIGRMPEGRKSDLLIIAVLIL